jgi:hypothetical protein
VVEAYLRYHHNVTDSDEHEATLLSTQGHDTVRIKLQDARELTQFKISHGHHVVVLRVGSSRVWL